MSNASRRLAAALAPSPKKAKPEQKAKRIDPVINSKIQFGMLEDFGKRFISQDMRIWEQWGFDPVNADMNMVFAEAFKVCPGLAQDVAKSALIAQIKRSVHPVVFAQLFA